MLQSVIVLVSIIVKKILNIKEPIKPVLNEIMSEIDQEY